MLVICHTPIMYVQTIDLEVEHVLNLFKESFSHCLEPRLWRKHLEEHTHTCYRLKALWTLGMFLRMFHARLLALKTLGTCCRPLNSGGGSSNGTGALRSGESNSNTFPKQEEDMS